MRKTKVILIILLFCDISCLAQDKMGKAVFEHLVDYANCHYLMTFIPNSDVNNVYIQNNYENNIKPVLEKATLEDLNNVPSFDKIKSLFIQDDYFSALNLATKINDRKSKYDEYTNNDSLFRELKVERWNRVYLTETARTIQNNINAHFGAMTEQTTAIESELEGVSKQFAPVDELTKKIEIMQKTTSILRLLVFICLILIVLLFASLLFWHKTQFNSNKRKSFLFQFVLGVIRANEEEKEMFVKPTNLCPGYNNIDMFEDKLMKLERQFGDLYTKVNSIETKDTQKTADQMVSVPSDSSLQKDNGFYFASKSNKQLTEQLSNSEGASFKIYSVNGNEAEFEYMGSVRNENWFEGVCDIENSHTENLSDKKKISTTSPGIVRKENDNWFVVTPAKIKFQ
jgi:hypothetical protein